MEFFMGYEQDWKYHFSISWWCYGTFGNLLAYVTFSAHFQAIELDWQVEKWRSNEIRFDAIFQLPLNAVIDDPMEK